MPKAKDGSKFGDAKDSIREILNKKDQAFRDRFYRNMKKYSEDRLLYEVWARDSFFSSGRSQISILEKTAMKEEDKIIGKEMET